MRQAGCWQFGVAGILAWAGVFLVSPAAAGEHQKAAEPEIQGICRLFDLAAFYRGEEGELLESLAFKGRLNADAAFFHEAPEREFDALLWRRVFGGFEAKFRGDVTLHAEAEFELNEKDPAYRRLTETYLDWVVDEALELRVGKQSASFTLDGKTSSRLLIRPERSLLSFNLWFPDNFYTGVTASGKVEGWVYNTGWFSSAGGNEFGDFDAGSFQLMTLGRDWGKHLHLDKAFVGLDLVHNEEHPRNVGIRNLAKVVSLNGRFEQGDFGVWTDVAFAEGYRTQSNLFGLEIMPFYNITKKLQVVTSYNHVTSSGANGVLLDRYENAIEAGRSDRVDEFFAGVNYYFCGHQLKWQNGVEYTTASDSAGDGGEYDGWGYTSAVRMFW